MHGNETLASTARDVALELAELSHITAGEALALDRETSVLDAEVRPRLRRGLGSPLPASAPGLGSPPAASEPGTGLTPSCPDLRRGLAAPATCPSLCSTYYPHHHLPGLGSSAPGLGSTPATSAPGLDLSTNQGAGALLQRSDQTQRRPQAWRGVAHSSEERASVCATSASEKKSFPTI